MIANQRLAIGLLLALVALPAFAGDPVAPIPEPLSAAVLAVGAAGAFLVRRLRARRG